MTPNDIKSLENNLNPTMCERNTMMQGTSQGNYSYNGFVHTKTVVSQHPLPTETHLKLNQSFFRFKMKNKLYGEFQLSNESTNAAYSLRYAGHSASLLIPEEICRYSFNSRIHLFGICFHMKRAIEYRHSFKKQLNGKFNICQAILIINQYFVTLFIFS